MLCIIFINQIKGTSIIKIQRRKSLPFFRKQSICCSQLQLTILHASGYILSVTTPWLWVTWSTISFSAALFTSFHLRSDSGSTIKSKRVQHCWSFWINKLSFSFGAMSRKKKNLRTFSKWCKVNYDRKTPPGIWRYGRNDYEIWL